jgi:hypothetical protein
MYRCSTCASLLDDVATEAGSLQWVCLSCSLLVGQRLLSEWRASRRDENNMDNDCDQGTHFGLE